MAVDSEGGEYAGKITRLVVLSCLIAATGGIIFGYDLGISGGLTSMESFLKEFFPEVYKKMKEETKTSNYCKFDSQLLTLFTSSLYIAGLIASFFSSPVTRAFGRKISILIGGTAILAGAAFGGASYNIYMLLLGRVLLGVGLGFTNQVGLLNVDGYYNYLFNFIDKAVDDGSTQPNPTQPNPTHCCRSTTCTMGSLQKMHLNLNVHLNLDLVFGEKNQWICIYYPSLATCNFFIVGCVCSCGDVLELLVKMNCGKKPFFICVWVVLIIICELFCLWVAWSLNFSDQFQDHLAKLG